MIFDDQELKLYTENFTPIMMIENRTSEFSDLISPRRDIDEPIYNWHSFKHSYSKDLVDVLVSDFKLKQGSTVLDPFCGGGTTLLACKQSGIHSKGIDILPFSVFLSNVKSRNYDSTELKRAQQKLLSKRAPENVQMDFPRIEIAKHAFNKSVTKELLSLKQLINQIENVAIKDFFRLGLLGILESVSNTVK